MSKRKREAIAAAREQAKVQAVKKSSFWRQLKSPTVLAAIGIGLLVALGVVGGGINKKGLIHKV